MNFGENSFLELRDNNPAGGAGEIAGGMTRRPGKAEGVGQMGRELARETIGKSAGELLGMAQWLRVLTPLSEDHKIQIPAPGSGGSQMPVASAPRNLTSSQTLMGTCTCTRTQTRIKINFKK